MAEVWDVTTKVMKTSVTKCTCGFKGYNNHKGADLIPNSTSETPEILAYDEGTVISTGNVNGTTTSTGTKGMGTYVAIKHADGKITRYQHLKYNSLKVKKGDKVRKGQAIGIYGRPTTGNSSGCHLHFDISLPTKPSCDYIKSTFCGQTVYYVDPKPYLCETATKTVTASALRVRAGAGLTYAVVKVLPQGTKVTVTDTVKGWAKVDGGWVMASYLK